MKVFLIVLFLLPVVTIAGSVNVLSSFYSPDWFPNGLAWDGNHLWVSCRGTQMIYEMSKDGTILSSFPIPHEGVRDMAWNGANLFYAAKNDKLIVEVTTDGIIIDTYDVTGISSDMKPTALTFDGTNFWVSDQEHDIIYEVELTGVSLEQYTFGRIKKLFQ